MNTTLISSQTAFYSAIGMTAAVAVSGRLELGLTFPKHPR
jgi:hypothetical protein